MEPLQKFKAVHLRQAKIKKHQVKRGATFQFLERIEAVDRCSHLSMDTFKSSRQVKNKFELVINNENGERPVGSCFFHLSAQKVVPLSLADGTIKALQDLQHIFPYLALLRQCLVTQEIRGVKSSHQRN